MRGICRLRDGYPTAPDDLLRHALLMHNLFFDSWGSINAPNWAIGLEFQWYVLAFFAIPFLRRAGIISILWGGLSVSLVWQVMTLLRFHHAPDFLQTNLVIFSSQLPGVIFHFFLGSLITRIRPLMRKALPLGVMTAAFILFLAVMGVLDYEFQKIHEEWPIWTFIFVRPLLAVTIAGLLYCIYDIEVNRRACAIPLYLGTISYGIYLWRQIVLDILKKYTQGGLLVAATLTVVVGLSSLSWAFLEKPILRKAQ